jgi:hypothetical protein
MKVKQTEVRCEGLAGASVTWERVIELPDGTPVPPSSETVTKNTETYDWRPAQA